MTKQEEILYIALEFMAHHDEGDHGVKSFRDFAKRAIIDYWKVINEGD